MPSNFQQDDETDDDSWDDADDDDDKMTVPCPYCRRPVYEDAEYCNNCDEYISLEDAPPERKPLWIIVTASLCLLAILLWFIR